MLLANYGYFRVLIVNPTTKLTTNSCLTLKCRCNNGNNDNNDNIRAGVISDAGGGAETRFQPTVLQWPYNT